MSSIYSWAGNWSKRSAVETDKIFENITKNDEHTKQNISARSCQQDLANLYLKRRAMYFEYLEKRAYKNIGDREECFIQGTRFNRQERRLAIRRYEASSDAGRLDFSILRQESLEKEAAM